MLGTTPESVKGSERVAQRALEGFTRSLGKEIGRGGTVQLVYVDRGRRRRHRLDAGVPPLPQVGLRLRPGRAHRRPRSEKQAEPVADWARPLEGKIALVTGASRGIGEQIARVLHRDGAKVVGVDVPQAASELQALMRELDGDHLTLDITGKDAPQRIAHHLATEHGGVDIVVHNAGITRDKKLANMAEDRWSSVIGVNLTAPERITRQLLDDEVINDNGRVIGVASIAGIAGNVGQTNYAASKAGVIGLVDSLADELGRGITINAVAPGFIITAMTAAVPFATREVGQRLNAHEPGRAAGRRRRGHRVVRLPRLDRRQRQRRAGLRPDDAGRLMTDRRPADRHARRAQHPAQGRAARRAGRQPAARASKKASAEDFTGLSYARTGVEVDPGRRRCVRRGLRLPPQGHRAPALPAPAGVPPAHGDHERPGVPLRRRSAWCTSRTPSPLTARSRSVRCST